MRDAYRSIKAIGRRAKELGRNVSAYTIDLFTQLAVAGKGAIQRTGRLVKFLVGAAPPPTDSPASVTEPVTVVTVPQSVTLSGLEVSPPSEVSPVTVENFARIDLDDTLNSLTNDEVNLAISSEMQVDNDLLSPLSPPTAQELAALILRCQTWVELVEAVNQDGVQLLSVAKMMTPEQRSCLTTMLATHLCENPSDLNQLKWVPVKLRDRALQRLTFTIRRIGGANILDASVEFIKGCKFVSVFHLGDRHEQWVFSTPDGNNIPVFGIDAIEALALSDGSDQPS